MVTAFEPKDARVTFEQEFYSDDDSVTEEKWFSLTKPRKRKTGTQALVEFLNTTSPEEFKTTVQQSKRSSSPGLFFKRCKPKSKKFSMTTVPTVTMTTGQVQLVHRKKYIEIITQESVAHQKRNLSPASSILTCTNEGFVRRQPSLRFQPANDRLVEQQPMIQLDMTTEHDIIEHGLKQRLALYRSSEKPSDAMSKSIAQEHLATLSDTPSYELQHKKRARHVQIQTMPIEQDLKQKITVLSQDNSNDESETECDINDVESIKQRLKKVEKELRQEKLINARLEAALEETRDQFEVLSGLAYKKIKEVWQEKIRWEEACMQVKERCWQDHQQQILGDSCSLNN
ncbi:uncharacterized protein B0P05DRAFT_526454 [Gilbertella persicaria]|uniref:uncharacterized protein n=1 Tax=Gilbertella persicaria TaxID=101096 RepID=UPI002220582A|nr:uncharacterized protein B0P05DRAFT_526454 [Gilbertella persicaria]KAI8091177.1 hypothetical protein B0P05DRAFT_526454 [Gilbertella persicaria]